MRYQSLRDDDAELRDAIKRVLRKRRRFGYFGVYVMIAREDFTANYKKVRCINTEERHRCVAGALESVFWSHRS